MSPAQLDMASQVDISSCHGNTGTSLTGGGTGAGVEVCALSWLIVHLEIWVYPLLSPSLLWSYFGGVQKFSAWFHLCLLIECVCTALTTRHLQPHRQSLTLHFLLMYIPIDKGTKWNFPVHLHLISSSDSVWASFLCSVCWLIRQRGNLQRRAYLNWFAYLNVCVDRECE